MLTIFAKRSIIDIWQGLQYVTKNVKKSNEIWLSNEKFEAKSFHEKFILEIYIGCTS